MDKRLKEIEKILSSLPQPRLINLILLAKEVAYKKIPNMEKAGNWLGGTRRLINYKNKR